MKVAITASRRWVAQAGWRYVSVVALLCLAALAGRHASPAVLAVFVAAAGLVLVLENPRWGLLALPVLSAFVPFEMGTSRAISLNLTTMVIPSVALFWSAQQMLKRRFHWPSSRLDRPLVAFLLVTFMSLLRSAVLWDPAVPRPRDMLTIQMAQVSIYLLSYVVFRLTANLTIDLKWLRRLAYSFVGTIGGAGILLLVVRPPGVTMPMLSPIWMVALALAMASYDPGLRRWQRGLLLAFGIAGPIGLRSLAQGWVALWAPPVVAGAVVLWLRSSASRWSLVIGLVIALVFVGLSGVQSAVNWETEWETSGSSRVALWRSVIELTSDSPLVGLGPAAYRHYHYLKPLAYGGALWLEPNVSAHNQFVDLFAQVGIVGLACYMWFLVEATCMAFRLYARLEGFARGYALAVLGALAGVLVADMVAASSLPFLYNNGFPGLRGSALHWMLLGGLVVLENLDSERKPAGAAAEDA